MPRNLVLARVGASSLHPGWFDAGAPRDWDLRLVPYQALPDQSGLELEVGPVVPGPKWAGIREALRTWDDWRDYDFIWMPDDDVAAPQTSINRMFEVAAGVGLDLFAPALAEGSYFAHFDTIRNPRFFGRWTGFVEIMIPGFSRAALEQLLPTLDESETGWGWGLDSVWPKLLEYRNVGIIDGVPVTHTRPVGAMRDPELRERVHAESDQLLAKYECRQEHVTLGAFDESLTALELSPQELLVRLAEGWEALIEQDPRILAWLADFQLGRFGVPAYPTAGTPG
jgi:hypothetical protein